MENQKKREMCGKLVKMSEEREELACLHNSLLESEDKISSKSLKEQKVFWEKKLGYLEKIGRLQRDIITENKRFEEDFKPVLSDDDKQRLANSQVLFGLRVVSCKLKIDIIRSLEVKELLGKYNDLEAKRCKSQPDPEKIDQMVGLLSKVIEKIDGYEKRPAWSGLTKEEENISKKKLQLIKRKAALEDMQKKILSAK